MNLFEHAHGIAELLKANKVWLYILALILFIPLLLTLVAFLIKWDASFSVSAETQYFEVASVDSIQPLWFFTNSDLQIGEGEIKAFSGTIQVPPGGRIIGKRIGKSESVLTVYPSQLPAGNAITLTDSAQGISTTASSPIQVAPRCTDTSLQVVLPLTGSLALGKEIGSATDADSHILVSGIFRVLGRELRSSNRFVAGEWTLDSGDRLSFDLEGGVKPVGAGFAIIHCDQPNMLLTFHGLADSAVVSRFGAAGYSVKPMIWARLTSDSFFQLALVLYSSLVPFLLLVVSVIYRLLRPSAKAEQVGGPGVEPTANKQETTA
jgi:hypothetical protein